MRRNDHCRAYGLEVVRHVLHAGLLAHDADHFQATLCEFCVYVHAGKSVRELLYFLEFW
jgi:hypothetical protein